MDTRMEPREDEMDDAPSHPPPSEASPDLCAFLTPAQGPGELGRLGPYRVLRILGAGGMGVVFQAEDPQLKRKVALKAMLPALAASESARKRFLREAQAAAAVKDDHIVTIHQVGEDRGVPFLAMEFLDGETLDDRLQRELALPMAEVLRIGREIAEGLAAAHEHGLIHRDIKPANIWLEGRRARVKILDFGLARAMADDAHLTQPGLVVGTPAYMAPEQAQAQTPDHRADLFSLGCVIYQMATGRVPFQGKDVMSTLTALATQSPQPARQLNPTVPAALSDLVMQLLAKKPSQRPRSARAVAEAIQAIPVGPGRAPATGAVPARAASGAKADSVSALTKVLTPGVRRAAPLVALVAAAAALLLLGLLGVGALLFGPAAYRFATNRGQLAVDTTEPGVEVVIKQGGQTVGTLDSSSKRELTLKAGTYQLELPEGREGLRLSTDQVTLTRGGRITIEVRHDATVVRKGSHDSVPAADGDSPRDPVDLSKPAVLRPGKVVTPLPGRIADVALGGSGRYLILHLPDARTLSIYDVHAAKVVRSIPAADDNVKFAAGADKLIVVLGSTNIIQRWSLTTFQRELASQLPIHGVVKSLSMGSASQGPLLIHWAVGTGALDRASFGLLDIRALRLLPTNDVQTGHYGSYRDIVHVRAAPDGQVYGLWCTSHTPQGLMTLVLKNNTIKTYYDHTSAGHVVPSADGKVVCTGIGLYTNEGKALGADQRVREACLPAYQGSYYLSFKPRQRRGGLDVHMIGDARPLAHLEDVEIPILSEQWVNHDFTLDKRILFLPQAKCILTIPTTNDQVVLHPFDVELALENSGLDYLLVTSQPPSSARRGETFAYQLGVKSKRGGVRYHLESGPDGMAISEGGKVTWKVPANFADVETAVIVSITDAAGQEQFHTFKFQIRAP
jgi:hypothetical protein